MQLLDGLSKAWAICSITARCGFHLISLVCRDAKTDVQIWVHHNAQGHTFDNVRCFFCFRMSMRMTSYRCRRNPSLLLTGPSDSCLDRARHEIRAEIFSSWTSMCPRSHRSESLPAPWLIPKLHASVLIYLTKNDLLSVTYFCGMLIPAVLPKCVVPILYISSTQPHSCA